MGRATDLVQVPSTGPCTNSIDDEHDEHDEEETDDHGHLQSLRSTILLHLATALATAAEKIARETAGEHPFENDEFAKRAHALLKLLPDLLPLLPQPEDQRDYCHPNAIRALEAIRRASPICPFCRRDADHHPDYCPDNPDGMIAYAAREGLPK
jgi:hypothetical protein